MKITPEHFEYLKQAITPLDTSERRKICKELGLSGKRYRWDLTYTAKLSKWICDELYPYMNDDHIDTALRKIIK